MSGQVRSGRCSITRLAVKKKKREIAYCSIKKKEGESTLKAAIAEQRKDGKTQACNVD